MIDHIKKIPDLWDCQKIVQRNEFLVSAGSIDQNTYLVLEGAIRVFLTINEEEHTIRFGYKDSMITPLYSFFEKKPSPFYFQAIRKTIVMVMPKNKLDHYIANNEQGSKLYNRLLEELVLQQMEREIDILTTSPAERLRRVMERSPRLFQEIPSKYIASYLRMSPETLSRISKS